MTTQNQSSAEPPFVSENGPAEQPSRARIKMVVAGAIGHFVEWYDFAVYGFMAIVIAELFFPAGDSFVSLLAAFGVYGVGYVMRPLGAIIFGHYGDRVGRRNALGLSIILMGVATTVMGLLPTYASVGVIAPILLVLARLVQGLSVGGEFAGGAAFLVESAGPRQRGHFGGWQQFTTGAGFLAGSLVGTLVTTVVSEDVLYSYAWRIPFLVALVVAAIGFYIRLGLEDTPLFRNIAEASEVAQAPLKEAVREQWRPMLSVLGVSVMWTIAYTVFLVFIPSYLATTADMPLSRSLAAHSIGLAVFVVLCPVFGALSDRVGRKPLMLAAAAGFVVLSVPAFIALSQGSMALVVPTTIAIAIMLAMFSGPAPAALAELFPTRVRYSGLSTAYGIGVAAFGGTAGVVATLLISEVGHLAPGFYMAVAAAVTVVTVVLMRESAHSPLKS